MDLVRRDFVSSFSWEKVCCPTIFGFSGEEYEDRLNVLNQPVSYRDHEKIVTSSSFRRLQGKTQVYPFPKNDFVRNRLTHTIEVAHIGRTIAQAIVDRSPSLIPTHKISIPQLAANGCLLHDIGNPPFGHSGESSIREFFLSKESDIKLVRNAFNKNIYKTDFTRFDGNAQGFRVITRLSGWKDEGGLRLSSATLLSMIKYAFPSDSSSAEKGKFGYMASEQSYAERLFEQCGMSEGETIYRSPISLIVEAADDIAYLTSDVQDAHKNRDIDDNRAIELLNNLSGGTGESEISGMLTSTTIDREKAIGYLRSAAVSYMMKAAVESLKKNVFNSSRQVKGTDKFDLWSPNSLPDAYHSLSTDGQEVRSASKDLIYRGERKLSLQVGGGRIIKFVLKTQLDALEEITSSCFPIILEYPVVDKRLESEKFVGQSLKSYVDKIVDNLDRFSSRESAQIFWGMPGHSRDRYKALLVEAAENRTSSDDPTLCYSIIQISVDFVSGTTDRFLSDYSRSWSGPYINV